MLVAYNGMLMRIVAANASRDGAYTCPGCREPVILKRGEIVTPHFAHAMRDTTAVRCPYPPESPEHLAAKHLIWRELEHRPWVNRIDLEVPIGSRRADAWVETTRGNRIAIEIQASSIRVEEMRAKMLDYRARGVLVLYVVHGTAFPGFAKTSRVPCLHGTIQRVQSWVREIQDFYRSAYFGALFLYLVDIEGVWLATFESVGTTGNALLGRPTPSQRVHIVGRVETYDGLVLHRENFVVIAGTDLMLPGKAA